jgi:hypothetical protein
MPEKARYVIVDTNCYLRLYYSPLRPILGGVFGGLQLVTLIELAEEAGPGSNVAQEFGWMLDKGIQGELRNAVLKLREPKKSRVMNDAKVIRRLGDGVLKAHCAEQKIPVRTLSLADCTALATAMELNAILATDEWPLRHVAEQYDDEPIPLLSSVELLAVLEADGALTREQRVLTVRAWLKEGQNLHRDWAATYYARFGEAPPTAQDDKPHKA